MKRSSDSALRKRSRCAGTSTAVARRRKKNIATVLFGFRSPSVLRRICFGGNLLEIDEIHVPMHAPGHYTLAVLYMKSQTIRFYDSCDANDRVESERKALERTLQQYLAAYAEKKRVEDFDAKTFKVAHCNSPQQGNRFGCGMHVIMRMFALSSGGDVNSFKARDIPHCRDRLMLAMMREKQII